ncbi:MAG TPA: hypothetical protein V6C69_13370, partial [Trichormus sp.]
TAPKKPEDIGNSNADRVEHALQTGGASAARQQLMNDFVATTSDANSRAALQAEITRLQHDSSADHVLPAIAIDFAKANHLTDGGTLTQGDIGRTMTTEGGTPQLDFKALMGTTLSQNMGDIKSGALLGWLPGYQGINGDDLDRAAARYDAGRENTQFANMLEANNGALFHKIAGANQGIDLATLQAAVADDDAAKGANRPQDRFFTDDQRKVVDDVLKRMNNGDSSVNALMTGDDDPKNPDAITMDTLGKVLPANQAKLDPAAAATDTAPAVAGPAAADTQPTVTKIDVKAGEGDWDVAAQAMGLDDGQGTLAHQRAEVRAALKAHPDALQPLLALMKQLEAVHARPTTKDSFNFTGTGNDVKLQPDAPAQPS